MTTPLSPAVSRRVRGHARTIRGTGIRAQGMYRTASGYVADCSCGWSSSEMSQAEYAAEQHGQHKAAVLNGTWAAATAAELTARIANYEDILANIDKPQWRSLTREQVQGWLDKARAAA